MKTYSFNGWLFLDKPEGLSSNKVLQTIRKLYGYPKGGFVGTLDPLASGFLPVAIGKATKAIKYLEKDIVFNPKSSESYILLGKSYEGIEDQDNALKYYEIAFTLIPHNLELNYLIGKVSYELGLIEQYAEQISNLEILCETSCKEIVKLKDLAE